MYQKHKRIAAALALAALLTVGAGCSMNDNANSLDNGNESAQGNQNENQPSPIVENSTGEDASSDNNAGQIEEEPDEKAPSENESETDSNGGGSSGHPGTGGVEQQIQVASEPESVAVLVNKQSMLPDDYEPDDLVYPDVPFIFDEMLDKRKMRKEAAEALESMFAAAEQDGIYLAGVSGYRSRATQESLYNNYVARDGKEAADMYSAQPGHSEHQTGLAMDVSGSTGQCAAQDCFGDTEEAKWLADHAHEHGFIIRYPLGKEEITGYQYEPWHLRYVGEDIAADIYEQQITLEEYLGEAVPVDHAGS
ncbi:D-alanyl-D-alanine carboxypeptidase family protein [Marinicrinis lubricantis]|uniref:D-alanyl-D-alanine carboxypeptidase family protein n=1 Tax=Marinicrinis lubricantis TaxID=2086470 RepID=A0ABW1IJJ4_9BACL